MAAYDEEIQLTQRLIALQDDQLHMAQTQLNSGLIAQTQVESQRQQLAQARASLAPLLAHREQSRHLLSILMGQSTQQALPDLPRLDDLQVSESVPLSLPSELVRQRPDILQAEAAMHLSSAQVGVAQAALWPSFSISATDAQANPAWPRLMNANSNFWSVGPNMTVPLTHGGSLSHEARAAEQGLQAAQANYRQVVLAAMAQVADALTGMHADDMVLQAQQTNAAAAQRSLALARVNWTSGNISRQDLQSADILALQAQLTQRQAQGQRLQDDVALFTALGGQWWQRQASWAHPSPAPTPTGASAAQGE